MKRITFILFALFVFCAPVMAQDAIFATNTPQPAATAPVEVPADVAPVYTFNYDGVIAGLVSVILLLVGLSGYLGAKTSNLVPPEAVALILRAATMTPSKRDDDELKRLFAGLGYEVTETDGAITVKQKAAGQ